MRSVTALDVRRSFGRIVDEAAAGERFVIERAGQPIAAIVPLADLALVDPELRKAERLRALDDIARMARRLGTRRDVDAAAVVRQQRDARTKLAADRADKARS